MLFNSLTFLIFFAILYPAYRLLPFRGQNWLLLGAGYLFYGWWDVRFLFLIAFSTTVPCAYVITNWFEDHRGLALGIFASASSFFGMPMIMLR